MHGECGCAWVSALVRHEKATCHPVRTAPPLTLKISPEMKPAKGVQRKRIGPAISVTWPGRPTGMVGLVRAATSGASKTEPVISVWVQPGATQLAEMPCGASSEERDLVRAMIAPLLVA